MTTAELHKIKKAAAPHQREHGVVVMFGLKFAGWMNELRSPEHWEPGCVAVTPGGNAYLATGGDAYNGAESWTAV